MKRLIALSLSFSCLIISLSAQNLAEMEAKLNRPATSKPERLTLAYTLAEKHLSSNPAKAADFAHRASMLASELKDNRREVGALMLCADANMRRRNSGEANSRYTYAYNRAKEYGMADQALAALEKLQEIAAKNAAWREAYRLAEEENTLLRGGKKPAHSTSYNDPYIGKLETKLTSVEAENRKLREDLAKATGRTELLETNYRETETTLKELREQAENEISKKDEALARVTEQKTKVDSLVKKKEQLVFSLTKEQLADSIMLAKRERELEAQKKVAAEAKLAKEMSENLRNLLAVVAGFVLFIAFLFYLRYRAKKRTANKLEAQNAIIEEERKRSDNLLLNILPAAIAQELRQKSKVAPKKYENATVMFVDFKGFTNVSEKLAPEMLVEEIDYCFSNFDSIISQYRIEKIKTIGDAYMCASGLSDMNASPTDMVKAALEIQDFLLHLKAERQSRSLPCFEARIGIHTGPVVAGVVGTKKFAYDIWGDTVNIAARMEEACEPGKVNVSEDSYWLAKYEFEWENRGKVAAKNKGMIDMYYVKAIKA